MTGLEPAFPAWKAGVLPLDDIRMVPGESGKPPALFARMKGKTVGLYPMVERAGVAPAQELPPCLPTMTLSLAAPYPGPKAG